MDNFKRKFSVLIIICLLFSCSAHKEPPIIQPIQPEYKEQPITQHSSSAKIKPIVPDPTYKTQSPQLSNQRKIVAQHAINSLGIQYKWGGQSPKTGFDCSGLIVYTHKKVNIIIPRTANAQFDNGRVINKEDLQIADLVFFQNHNADKINHVGIYIGKGTFIHAPGRNRQITYGNMNNPYFKKNYLGSRTYL
jgi:cell wall-associated NlpC family hydrolase